MPDTDSISLLLPLTRIYQLGLRVVLILIPLTAIFYIHLFGNPVTLIIAHLFHEIAISIAIILSAFVSYVTWQCYRTSGETFLYWVVQGLTGFTLEAGRNRIMAERHNLADQLE